MWRSHYALRALETFLIFRQIILQFFSQLFLEPPETEEPEVIHTEPQEEGLFYLSSDYISLWVNFTGLIHDSQRLKTAKVWYLFLVFQELG